MVSGGESDGGMWWWWWSWPKHGLALPALPSCPLLKEGTRLALPASLFFSSLHSAHPPDLLGRQACLCPLALKKHLYTPRTQCNGLPQPPSHQIWLERNS